MLKALIFRTSAFLCLLSGTVCAGPSADLQRYLADTQSLRGEFQQVVTQRSGKVQRSSGTLVIAKPGKFRWEYLKPYQQLLLGDGKQVTLFDADLMQVTIKPQGKLLDASPAALLAGQADLASRYTLKELPEKDQLQWVELTPKQPDQSFERARIGLDKAGVKAMELDDHFNQTTRIQFDKLERNPKLAADVFNFTIPAGADVIRE
ncbi:outer membrane lipoprotein chaperone LolA [Chitinilyticum piscinae]|uniref:Outer-membrane lipoprotein carrier protein n=1 Tax=Chitinilyticum piscinae TaxID=2866724 RepID=A0A8J7FJT1_9NEIS|nr:outer membrane lipoprotein chaperone LolA [Chitinilyticum piscinae]MBE9610690.1 outer membrane lipoprotein chaperone LolA [Chitinilyticum piscinae]